MMCTHAVYRIIKSGVNLYAHRFHPILGLVRDFANKKGAAYLATPRVSLVELRGLEPLTS